MRFLLPLLLVSALACVGPPAPDRVDDEPTGGGHEVSDPGTAPGDPGCPPPAESADMCAAVMVYAQHPDTGACCEYSSPCVAPQGWAAFGDPAECAAASSAPASTSAYADLEAPDPAWLSCGTDADCAVVEIGCCDHCNGGRVIPVNTSSAGEAETRYHAECPDDQRCTMRGCFGPEAACESGQCALRRVEPNLPR